MYIYLQCYFADSVLPKEALIVTKSSVAEWGVLYDKIFGKQIGWNNIIKVGEEVNFFILLAHKDEYILDSDLTI